MASKFTGCDFQVLVLHPDYEAIWVCKQFATTGVAVNTAEVISETEYIGRVYFEDRYVFTRVQCFNHRAMMAFGLSEKIYYVYEILTIVRKECEQRSLYLCLNLTNFTFHPDPALSCNSQLGIVDKLMFWKPEIQMGQDAFKLIEQRSISAFSETAASKCVTCLDKNKDTAFMQCGHLCICWECAKIFRSMKLLKCPICRRVNGSIRTFYSS